MNQTFYMFRLLIVSIILVIFKTADAQFVSKIIDFLPAPGQYTNAEFIGTPEAANSIVGTNKGMVSLGAYGGSITVYFENGIQNDPANPYGVDFTIYGNSTPTWSEPGIIQVMKDENHNGLPDDTWYEIAGSDHHWNSTIPNYEVTYQNSGLNTATDIHWTDNIGNSGIIPENSFHQQTYYPKAQLFRGVSADQYTLKGTKISGQIDLSNPGVVNSYRRTFGYADNTPVISFTEKMPDNPYTPEIEGSGGDAIDIGWAVDSNRNPVSLDEIHFIRIYTGMNTLAGWLGEISTEITGIRDVEPSSISGAHSIVVIQDLPSKIIVGETVNLNAFAFESGIKQNTGINWSISNSDLAGIENSQIIAKKSGVFQLRASSTFNPSIFAEKQIEIFSVGKAVITLPLKSLKVNDKLELTGKLTDQNNTTLSGISTSWRIENKSIAEITSVDGKYFLKGKQPGKCWLYLESIDFKSIRDSVQIEVFPESVKKKVFITVKTSEKTIFPRQSVWVDQVDLTSKVDRHQKLYGLAEIGFVSLAHAIAAVFKNNGLENDWAFRDDAEGGSSLYLWKIPQTDEGSTSYNFGYGGSRTSEAFRKTWIVVLNQQPFISGFDRIKVNNEDEILVFQIVDNALPWTVTQLTSGADTVKTNQNIDVQLKKYSCEMDINRNVTINSMGVVAGQTIQIGQNNQFTSHLITDEFGKATFKPEKSGEYLISSGIDATKLVAEPITGFQLFQTNSINFSVLPNPFNETIRIDCTFPMESIQIYNVLGKLVFCRNNPSPEVNLSSIPSGIYLLRLNSGSQLFQQKIIKN
jgi:Secretion system C-terminal sorting domain